MKLQPENYSFIDIFDITDICVVNFGMQRIKFLETPQTK